MTLKTRNDTNDKNNTKHDGNINYDVANVDGQPTRRLTVLFGWLFSRPRHLAKYRQLYHERGFDVLTIQLKLGQFLHPSVANGSHRVAKRVLRFLSEHRGDYDCYVFHCFSIGAYMMGELFLQLYKTPDIAIESHIYYHLKGIVYDSPVDLDQAASALSKATTSNVALRPLIYGAVKTYMAVTYPFTTRHYKNVSTLLKGFAFTRECIFLTSKSDHLSDLDIIVAAAEKWKTAGIDARIHLWEESRHVTHLIDHRDEYIQQIDAFLARIL